MPETIAMDACPEYASNINNNQMNDSTVLSNGTLGERAVATGRKFIANGAKYKTSNSDRLGPTYFDCCGFTYACYKECDVDISAAIGEQRNKGTIVFTSDNLDYSKCQVGDLIWRYGTGPSGLHVLMIAEVYSNKLKVIHASGQTKGVLEEEITLSSGSFYEVRRYGL